jgi:uncharacterized repeat protein (TIGR02543 family)
MKKLLIVLLATTAITLSSTSTYAASTPTNVSLDSSTVSSTVVQDIPNKISLDDSIRLSVSLQSNSLVFSVGQPLVAYDGVIITLLDINADKIVEKHYYKKSEVNGATIDLADLADGSYDLRTLKSAKGIGNSPFMYAFTIEVKGGVATFKSRGHYNTNLKDVENERTDAVAIDYYRCSTDANNQANIKQANIITAGITNDYDKAKAISEWVTSHLIYNMLDFYVSNPTPLYPGSAIPNIGKCGDFADATYDLLEGAGLPAKIIEGTEKGVAHAWNEVYVDGRWVFVDSTMGLVDVSLMAWSVAYDSQSSITYEDAKVWDGTVYFIDPKQNKVLQEIKNIPAGSLLTETYGYNASDLYSDGKLTIPWNFATDKISSHGAKVFVKTYGFTVKFDSQGGTAVDSEVVTPETSGRGKVTEPTTPTKDGYTFLGWAVGNPYNATLWKFDTNEISYDVTFYAKWQAN